MANRPSCEQLRREHEVIGQVLTGVAALLERRRAGAEIPSQPICGALDFFEAFVDRCHDAKEEALFPLLERRQPPDGIVLETLRAEHREARRLVEALRPLVTRHHVSVEAIPLLGTYIDHVRGHMARENACLLPFAERVLAPEDEANLLRAFQRVEERTVGAGGRDVLLALGTAVTQACRAAIADADSGRSEVVVRQVMRRLPGIVAPDESLARAAELMASVGTRELPVVAGHDLAGILTRSDMEPHRGHYEWTPVRAAMTPDPITVHPETPVRAVARLLLGHGFDSVPVIDGGEVVGLIGRSDLLRVLADGR